MFVPRADDARGMRKRKLRPDSFKQPDDTVHGVLDLLTQSGKPRSELIGKFHIPVATHRNIFH